MKEILNFARQPIIALLGRRDEPTDGLRDYCTFLAAALARRGIVLQQAEVRWDSQGWQAALRQLSQQTCGWRGKWVLVQYTSLSWSRRGAPLGALAVLRVLGRCGARCAIVFHEPQAWAGTRLQERARAAIQAVVLRRAYRSAEKAIFTVPLERIPWMPAEHEKAIFIPIGANLPEPASVRGSGAERNGTKTIAVFGITQGAHTPREVEEIAYAASHTRSGSGHLRLVVLGRGSEDAHDLLLRSLKGTGVELSVLGILPAQEVARTLISADALLFVRGELTPQRGSAIAGIACGLPVVAYGDPQTSFPLTNAGVELVPRGDKVKLAAALRRVLEDEALWKHLCERNARAMKEYFSWDAIAQCYLQVLGK